ncbi:unnamed protein product [Mytilus coruscus]|uniref:Uncharacterized protein n=1 Tax=Mytilus coruscus TaxID=42192 RepID=A0A6J8DAJ7_MYTCO|nr:unnamed protein product [Mytilus coruscus]
MSQNNQQDRYSHNQTINRQANPGLFGTKHHSNSSRETNAFVMGNDVATSDDHMTKSICYGIQGATYGEQVLGSEQFVNNSMSINNHTDRVHDFNTGVMKRSRDETTADFGYALKRLGSRAFPTIPVMMRESLIVEQYISGLGSAELKRHVQFAHPTTLDRAISLAVEFEAFEGAQIYSRKPKNVEERP